MGGKDLHKARGQRRNSVYIDTHSTGKLNWAKGMGGIWLCLVGGKTPRDNNSQYLGVWVSQPGGDKGPRMEDG